MKRSKLIFSSLAFVIALWFVFLGTGMAEELWAVCQTGEVTAYKGRVHIYCSNDLGGGVHYVASPTTDSDMYNRVLMIGMAAIAHSKTLYVCFDPADLSGVTWGCLDTDCRTALAVSLSQ